MKQCGLIKKETGMSLENMEIDEEPSVRGQFYRWMKQYKVSEQLYDILRSTKKFASPGLGTPENAVVAYKANRSKLKTLLRGHLDLFESAFEGLLSSPCWFDPLLESGIRDSVVSKWVTVLYRETGVRDLPTLRVYMSVRRHELLELENLGAMGLDELHKLAGPLWCDGLTHAEVGLLNQAGVSSLYDMHTIKGPFKAALDANPRRRRSIMDWLDKQLGLGQGALPLNAEPAGKKPENGEKEILLAILSKMSEGVGNGTFSDGQYAELLRTILARRAPGPAPVEEFGMAFAVLQDVSPSQNEFGAIRLFCRPAVIDVSPDKLAKELKAYSKEVAEASDLLDERFRVAFWRPGMHDLDYRTTRPLFDRELEEE